MELGQIQTLRLELKPGKRLKDTHYRHEPQPEPTTNYYQENVPKHMPENNSTHRQGNTHIHTYFPCQMQTSDIIHQYITTCSEASSSLLFLCKEAESKGAGHRGPFRLKPLPLCRCLAPSLIQTWQ